MIAIGLGLAYGAYTLGIWGYCLVRGYDVPFTAMFGQTWPGAGPGAGEQLIGPVKPGASGGAGEALIGPVKPGG